VTSALPILSIVIPLSMLVTLPAQAGSTNPWDGTWSGTVNKSEPVSVTITDGKVVGYTIRGVAPYPIQFSRVTSNTVSFGDRTNYNVRITKIGERVASGFAHSPMGDGSAALIKQ
jgi:hypothetical protein